MRAGAWCSSARRLFAAQGGHDPGEHDREPVAAGVDDAGVAQRREQFRAPLDRVLAGVDRALERGRDRPVLLARLGVRLKARVVGAVRDVGDDLVGHLAGDREDRALGRFAHGGVGAVGGVRERCADQRRVDQLAGPLIRAPRPRRGSAARGSRRSSRARRAAPRARPSSTISSRPISSIVRFSSAALQPVELVEHGPQRQRHVVAGVAVGDREHVEVVDLLAPGFQVRQGSCDGGPEADQVRVGHRVGHRDQRVWRLPLPVGRWRD